MTNPSPARPPLVLGDYNAQDQAASALVNCKVALSPEMAIRIGKATMTTPESWLSMQANLDLWWAAGKPAQSDYQSSAVNRTPWKGMVP